MPFWIELLNKSLRGRWGDYQKRGIVERSLTLSIDALVRAGLDPACEGSGSIWLDVPSGGASVIKCG